MWSIRGSSSGYAAQIRSDGAIAKHNCLVGLSDDKSVTQQAIGNQDNAFIHPFNSRLYAREGLRTPWLGCRSLGPTIGKSD
jgi:hypothetical protein